MHQSKLLSSNWWWFHKSVFIRVSLKDNFINYTLLNKKVNKGEGVKNHRFWDDIVYGWPLMCRGAAEWHSLWPPQCSRFDEGFFCYEKFSHHDEFNKAVDKWHDMHQHFNSDNNLWFYNHLFHFLEKFQFAMNDKLSKRTLLPFESLDLFVTCTVTKVAVKFS